MTTASPPSRPGDASSTKSQTTLRWAILILGSLIVLAMAYGTGLRQSTSKLRNTNEQLRAARADVAGRDTAIRQLEARRQLHLALLALDQRNFGIAQSRLNAAAILLNNAGQGQTGGLADLAQRIRATRVVAAADFAGQREQVLESVQQLDTILNASGLPGVQARVEDAPSETAP